MPIAVTCRCGNALSAPDNLAGKAVKCPKCGQPLSIPKPQITQNSWIADMLDDLGVDKPPENSVPCPGCSELIPQSAVVCVKCGYNSQTGKKVSTTVRQTKKLDGHEGATQALLEKAEQELDEKAKDSDTAPVDDEPLKDYLMAGVMAGITLVVLVCAILFMMWLHKRREKREEAAPKFSAVPARVVPWQEHRLEA